jgi:aspartyl-tRNA(Asn)/glutamyl-tRNA(Gln) amidotransferase subunit A
VAETPLSATEMVAAFRAGELSPVEAARDTLDRIAEVDHTVNAFCLVDEGSALEAARASEARWQAGTPAGPLDGVPVSIKDMFLTRGWPTLRGSRTVDPGQKWDADAPVVARLKEGGAVPVGKTTLPELAWKGVTDNPLTGVTRNPWDTSTTAGGSSGGSAAAVALGMAPISVGSDGGGSVRIPGAFTGTFAMKPTYGVIPLFPASPFGTLSHAGPMTWTVDDAARLMDVIARPDSRDWSALPPPVRPFTEAIGDGVAGLRIAFSPDFGYVKVDPEVAAAVARAVEAFTELGAHVEQVDPPITDPIDAFKVLWYSAAAMSLSGVAPEKHGLMDAGLREIAAAGAAYTAADYLEATAVRMDLGVKMGAFHDTYDLLLTPTLPIPAFTAGQEVPDGWNDPRWMSWTPFTYPFNMTQQPAATVPCGFTSAGLPIGLQVIGARHADARVMAACQAFATARSWYGKRPSPEAATA